MFLSSSKHISSRRSGGDVFGMRKKYDGKKADNEPGRCYRCGSVDHLMKDCTDTVGLHFDLDLHLPQLCKGIDTSKIDYGDDKKQQEAVKNHDTVMRMHAKAVRNRRKTQKFLSQSKDNFDLRKFASHRVTNMMVNDDVLKKPAKKPLVPRLRIPVKPAPSSVSDKRRYRLGVLATERQELGLQESGRSFGNSSARARMPFLASLGGTREEAEGEPAESSRTPRARFFRGRKGGVLPGENQSDGGEIIYGVSSTRRHEVPSVPPVVLSELIGDVGSKPKSGPMYPVSSKGLSSERKWQITECKEKMDDDFESSTAIPKNPHVVKRGVAGSNKVQQIENVGTDERLKPFQFDMGIYGTLSMDGLSSSGGQSTSRSNRKMYESESDSD